MKELKNLYFDFLDYLDPYWKSYTEEDEELTLSEMLYNLEEIKIDWQLEGEDLERIDEVIKAFKDAGIERSYE